MSEVYIFDNRFVISDVNIINKLLYHLNEDMVRVIQLESVVKPVTFYKISLFFVALILSYI